MFDISCLYYCCFTVSVCCCCVSPAGGDVSSLHILLNPTDIHTPVTPGTKTEDFQQTCAVNVLFPHYPAAAVTHY